MQRELGASFSLQSSGLKDLPETVLFEGIQHCCVRRRSHQKQKLYAAADVESLATIAAANSAVLAVPPRSRVRIFPSENTASIATSIF